MGFLVCSCTTCCVPPILYQRPGCLGVLTPCKTKNRTQKCRFLYRHNHAMGRLVGGRGAPGGWWELASSSIWPLGWFCMYGGCPQVSRPRHPKGPHFASWGHPHTHKTNPVAIVGYNRAHTTPPGAPISPHTATVCPLVFSYMISTEYLGFFVLLSSTQESGFFFLSAKIKKLASQTPANAPGSCQ